MNIPDPVGNVGDRVLVLNYRRKPSAWEQGEVVAASYRPAYVQKGFDGRGWEVAGRWVYRVWIDRPRTRGKYGREMGGGYCIEASEARPLP